MAEPYIGQITIFAGTFAPKGWAFCNGTILTVVGNESLFSLLGNAFGGDGVNTFALPDLRGRIPVGLGMGPGLSNWIIGERMGVEEVACAEEDMPPHSHPMWGSSNLVDSTDPSQKVLASDSGLGETPYVEVSTSPQAMMQTAVSEVGGSQPHPNMAPYMALNYIIALLGVYPSRN